jgi:hypothetical protein
VSILDGTNTVLVTVPLVDLPSNATVFDVGHVSVLNYRSLECSRQDFFFDDDGIHCPSVAGYVHNVTRFVLAVKEKGKLF